ncbi:unnamed protein product, partial [Urochloa humidicola]
CCPALRQPVTRRVHRVWLSSLPLKYSVLPGFPCLAFIVPSSPPPLLPAHPRLLLLFLLFVFCIAAAAPAWPLLYLPVASARADAPFNASSPVSTAVASPRLPPPQRDGAHRPSLGSAARQLGLRLRIRLWCQSAEPGWGLPTGARPKVRELTFPFVSTRILLARRIDLSAAAHPSSKDVSHSQAVI